MEKAAERERAAVDQREKLAAEREAAALADAPLPPAGRPASIDRPTPIEGKGVASLDEASEGRAARGKLAAEDAAPDERVLAAPLPPRRPKSLDKAFATRETPAKDRAEAQEKLAHAPTPPTRPKALAAAAPTTVKAPLPAPRPKHLGSAARGDAAQAFESIVATTGSIAKRDNAKPAIATKDNEPLAFAPAPKKPGAAAEDLAATRPAVTPARLDRSNFGAMTSVTPTSKALETTGGSVTSLRSAARANQDSPLAAPSSAAAKGFDDGAVKPVPTGFVKN